VTTSTSLLALAGLPEEVNQIVGREILYTYFVFDDSGNEASLAPFHQQRRVSGVTMGDEAVTIHLLPASTRPEQISLWRDQGGILIMHDGADDKLAPAKGRLTVLTIALVSPLSLEHEYAWPDPEDQFFREALRDACRSEGNYFVETEEGLRTSRPIEQALRLAEARLFEVHSPNAT
jgi:hypothetical protein